MTLTVVTEHSFTAATEDLPLQQKTLTALTEDSYRCDRTLSYRCNRRLLPLQQKTLTAVTEHSFTAATEDSYRYNRRILPLQKRHI